jgi:hypothetical protein
MGLLPVRRLSNKCQQKKDRDGGDWRAMIGGFGEMEVEGRVRSLA